MRDEPETGRKSARRVHARLAAAAVAMSGSYGRTNILAVCPSTAPLAECSGTGGPNRLAALDPPVEEVYAAHEVHDEFRRRMVEDLLGRSRLLDARLVHHHHTSSSSTAPAANEADPAATMSNAVSFM
jgi:hypothetical protein